MDLEVTQTKSLNDLLFQDRYTMRAIHQSSIAQVFGAVTDQSGCLVNKNTYIAYQGQNNQVPIYEMCNVLSKGFPKSHYDSSCRRSMDS